MNISRQHARIAYSPDSGKHQAIRLALSSYLASYLDDEQP